MMGKDPTASMKQKKENFLEYSFGGRAVVGLDLDGVVADYTSGFLPYAARYLGVSEDSLPEPTEYNLGAVWPFTGGRDYLKAHIQAVEAGLYRNLPLLPGAAEAIRELSAAGAHIRIVTHRLLSGGLHEKILCDTAAWLERCRIPYMSICFTGLKDSVGAHLYIEDAPTNIMALGRMGIPTFVYDQPYNRDVVGEHLEGRITSWEEGAGTIIDFLRDLGEL